MTVERDERRQDQPGGERPERPEHPEHPERPEPPQPPHKPDVPPDVRPGRKYARAR